MRCIKKKYWKFYSFNIQTYHHYRRNIHNKESTHPHFFDRHKIPLAGRLIKMNAHRGGELGSYPTIHHRKDDIIFSLFKFKSRTNAIKVKRKCTRSLALHLVIPTFLKIFSIFSKHEKNHVIDTYESRAIRQQHDGMG